MISQLDRTLDSNLLHVELYSRPFKKKAFIVGEEGQDRLPHPRHHTHNTFQIGNEDAGYRPSRTALRQFAQTQNDTSFHIGDGEDGEDQQQIAIDESSAPSRSSCKTSKRCFPRRSTVDNPPFGIQRDNRDYKNMSQKKMDIPTVIVVAAEEEVNKKSIFDDNSKAKIIDPGEKENRRPDKTANNNNHAATVDEDPSAFLEEQKENQSSSCSPRFKVHKTTARNIVPAEKLGFDVSSSDFCGGIPRNKVHFKERLQEIKQSLRRNSNNPENMENIVQPVSADCHYHSHYPYPGSPLSPDVQEEKERDEQSRIVKKPDPKELHRQVYYQSVVEAEKNMEEKRIEKDQQQNFDMSTNEDSVTGIEYDVHPSPPKQVQKLTNESGARQETTGGDRTLKNAVKTTARRRHFHAQSRFVYGSETVEALPSPLLSPSFLNKRSEPIALSLGYKLCDMDDGSASQPPPALTSEVTPQNSSEVLLDDILLDQMSFEDDSIVGDGSSNISIEAGQV